MAHEIVAVTGATGEMGGRVARRLADRGVHQRLIVRDRSRAPELPGAEMVEAPGGYIDREVKCVNEDGRIVIIAVQGGTKSEFNAGLVLRRRITITGSTLRPRPVAFKAAIAQALHENVWPLIESGRIKPVIHSTFPAAEAAKAHALMESNQHVGKIVLTW